MEKRIERIDEQIEQINLKLADPNLCEGTADVLTRVSGYYRQISNFNEGKAEEFVCRREYALAA